MYEAYCLRVVPLHEHIMISAALFGTPLSDKCCLIGDMPLIAETSARESVPSLGGVVSGST